MRIALVGPISTAGAAQFLDQPLPADFPVGYGGAPFINTQIARLLELGHEVVAVTCGGYPAERGSMPRALRGKRFEYWCCPARKHSIRPQNGRIGRLLDFFRFERRAMENVIRSAAPDIVHAHWTYEFAMAAMDSGIPCVVSAHDDPVEVMRQYKNLYRLGRYFMARSVLRRARTVTAVSADLRRRIAPLTSCEIQVVPNPLSRSFIDEGRLLPNKELADHPRIISVVNGWGRLKNMQNALVAFQKASRMMAGRVTYHLYGADYQVGGPAHRWATTHGLAEGVLFHGPVAHQELVRALEDANLMVHPSRSESCPMGIAEALAMGVPVIGGSRSGGVPWMVGTAGLLVDIEDSDEIAGAIETILSDAGKYSASSLAAKDQVIQLSPEPVVTRYLEIYESALRLKQAAA